MTHKEVSTKEESVVYAKTYKKMQSERKQRVVAQDISEDLNEDQKMSEICSVP